MRALKLNQELSVKHTQSINIKVTDAEKRLRNCVNEFLSINDSAQNLSSRFHRVVSLIHNLCYRITQAEEQGFAREEIIEIIKPFTAVTTGSLLIKRLHEWPRGYPGDFETIELLCNGKNQSKPDSVEYLCEMYALNSPIVQQHRNKVTKQADLILNTINKAQKLPKILSIACGGCPDINRIKKYITNLPFELILNDFDAAALAYSKDRLRLIGDKCRFIQGDIIRSLKEIARQGPFDLIIAGGLFDYLKQRHIEFLLKHLKSCLNTNGILFFTNIVKDDPYRVWREYLANWTLIERSEQDILTLTQNAGIDAECVDISRDATALSLFVEIKKKR
ncbi:MAG: class I SAM-dependent methyltransferase [Calditrichaeota bacterium]|nr:class I SAM-dependent methyltransferase [Calditrichota bacterium]